uniref:Variant surface glycoprotein 1251 n=1 Tax=Trypanosoma brucei TaxID=5691 RepID=M4SY15_9TRYP|nr:variant surface glycoprotein 1251 [Trypanosoma brucei]
MKAPTLILAAIAGLICCLSEIKGQGEDTETVKQTSPCDTALYITSLASELEKSRTDAVAALNTAEQDRMVINLALAIGGAALSRTQLLTLKALVDTNAATVRREVAACSQDLTTAAKLLHLEAGYQWGIDTFKGTRSGTNTVSALTVNANGEVDETKTTLSHPHAKECESATASAKTKQATVSLKDLKTLKLHKLKQPDDNAGARKICQVKCTSRGSCQNTAANAELNTLEATLLQAVADKDIKLDKSSAGTEETATLSTKHTELKDHRHNLQRRLIDFLSQNPCHKKYVTLSGTGVPSNDATVQKVWYLATHGTAQGYKPGDSSQQQEIKNAFMEKDGSFKDKIWEPLLKHQIDVTIGDKDIKGELKNVLTSDNVALLSALKTGMVEKATTSKQCKSEITTKKSSKDQCKKHKEKGPCEIAGYKFDKDKDQKMLSRPWYKSSKERWGR